MKNRFTGDMMAVLNQRQMAPLLIDPDDIKLTIIEYMQDHRRWIPKKFSLHIENDRLQVEVKIETLDVHHIKLPLINYWRYHLRIVGNVTLDGFTEKIDSIGISELTKFF